MSDHPEPKQWATRQALLAQQPMRRISPGIDSTPPPLPPLVPSNRDLSPFSRPRASTAEGIRTALDIPSVSTLNRNFDRLSLAYAGIQSEEDVQALPATHHARHRSRNGTSPTAGKNGLNGQSHAAAAAAEPAFVMSARPLPIVPHRSSFSVSDPPSPQRHVPPPPPPLPPMAPGLLLPKMEAMSPSSSSSIRSSHPSASISVSELMGGPGTSPLTPPAAAASKGGARDKKEKHTFKVVEAETVVPDDRGSSPLINLRSPKLRDPATAAAAPKGTTAAAVVISPTRAARAKTRDGRITVAVRKRPMSAEEATESTDCVQVDGDKICIAATKQRIDLSSYEECSDFTFDSVFDVAASNEDVYRTSVRDLLTVCLDGGSASCFAYGQTGSGKTYTMIGTDTERGLYLLAAADLFGRLAPGQELCVCFYEIYCNSLFDLLNQRSPLVLREDASRRIKICGVVWRTVATADELWQHVTTGMEQRRTGSTSANEHSSRSHAILSMRVSDATQTDFSGLVNFVDLAGSERAVDTASTDRVTRMEGAEINKSLLALKECIRSLDEKKKHVPFRGSRLTEVLRDSFTGNSKTVMIATISPSSRNNEHSNNTLRYAFRVKGLSIPSVLPSKARNAPRPYIPAPRSRSNVALNDRTDIGEGPVQRSRGRSSGGEACASPVKRRSERQSRQDAATETSNADIYETGESTDAPSGRKQSATRKRPVTMKKAPWNSAGSSTSTPCDAAITGLLPHTNRTATPRRSGSGQRTASAHSAARNNSRCSSAGSTSHLSDRHKEDSETPSVFATGPAAITDVVVFKRQVTQSIMTQLRRDLGAQLEDVLSEKDALIAALRRENASLRRELRRTGQGSSSLEGGHHNGSEESSDLGHRVQDLRRGSCPPSPTVVQEPHSCGVSPSSGSATPVNRITTSE